MHINMQTFVDKILESSDFSTYFLLKSLELVPAYVTFPFINIGLIISSGLIGHFWFKEQLSRKKILLMFLGIIAVFFLTT